MNTSTWILSRPPFSPMPARGQHAGAQMQDSLNPHLQQPGRSRGQQISALNTSGTVGLLASSLWHARCAPFLHMMHFQHGRLAWSDHGALSVFAQCSAALRVCSYISTVAPMGSDQFPSVSTGGGHIGWPAVRALQPLLTCTSCTLRRNTEAKVLAQAYPQACHAWSPGSG